MPSHTKAALPTRPVMGHDQAEDGSTDAKSASRATTAREERRHIRILCLTRFAAPHRSDSASRLLLGAYNEGAATRLGSGVAPSPSGASAESKPPAPSPSRASPWPPEVLGAAFSNQA